MTELLDKARINPIILKKMLISCFLSELPNKVLYNDFFALDQLMSEFQNKYKESTNEFEAERAEIERSLDGEDLAELIFQLDEKYEFLDDRKNLFSELAIIGAYKIVELTTKDIIRVLYNDEYQNKIGDLHKIKTIKDVFKSHEIMIDKLDGYNEMNEARLINNCIKHGGYVSNELAKNFPSWKHKEKITKLHDSYERLSLGCKNYLANLIESVKSR